MTDLGWIKIISGAQSGVDCGGLMFALFNNIECGANIFNDFRSSREYPKLKDKSGNILNWVNVNYVCNRINYIDNLRCRTEYNVKNSDVTIIIVGKPIVKTKGSKLTKRLCEKYKKQHIVIFKDEINYYDYMITLNEDYEVRCLDVSEILNKLYEIYNNLGSQKLTINIAGERSIDENYVVKILEKIFVV